MDDISMPDGFFGEQKSPKKEILYNQIVVNNYQKRKYFLIFTGKNDQKRKF